MTRTRFLSAYSLLDQGQCVEVAIKLVGLLLLPAGYSKWEKYIIEATNHGVFSLDITQLIINNRAAYHIWGRLGNTFFARSKSKH